MGYNINCVKDFSDVRQLPLLLVTIDQDDHKLMHFMFLLGLNPLIEHESDTIALMHAIQHQRHHSINYLMGVEVIMNKVFQTKTHAWNYPALFSMSLWYS
jgi:hypothetical protein